MGKLLILAGLTLVVLGALLTGGPKLPFHPGRLPGDLWIERGRLTFVFPVATCLVLSLLLTLLLNLFSRR